MERTNVLLNALRDLHDSPHKRYLPDQRHQEVLCQPRSSGDVPRLHIQLFKYYIRDVAPFETMLYYRFWGYNND